RADGPPAALRRREAVKGEVHPARVARRDPEAVADRAVRRRAAALDEDPARPRLAHDVPDDQEVAREGELLDQRELAGELLAHARRDGTIAPACAGLDQLPEVGDLGLTVGYRVIREAITEVLEREPAARGNLLGGGEGLGQIGEAPGHLDRRPQMLCAVRRQAPAEKVQRRSEP